jgi:lipopolysaccharide export system permease protein
MKISPTLSVYLSKQFLLWLLIGLGVCAGLVFLLDFVETLRKGAGRELPFGVAIQITFFKLPNLTMQIAPFAFLFGSILTFNKLTRSRELVVIRASGVSVWQFLMPPLMCALLIGFFIIIGFNPLGAAMNYHAEQLENKYLDSSSSLTTVSKSGLWLKQNDEATGTRTIITAAGISPDSRDFNDVTVFNFTRDFDFINRIDAKDATLLDKEWAFRKAIINVPDKTPEKLAEYHLPTNLTLAQIQDSFGSPDTMSFWELPDFISMMEASGFSALKHKLHFHTILTTPIILAAMVIIAAVYSLKYSRKGKTGLLILGAVLSGFVFFFITKLTASYGISGNMPIVLAAWTPAGIFILLGISLLLHQEEG